MERVMQAQQTLTDIPDGKLDEIVSDFESEGADVVKRRQPDGNWTVIATLPELGIPA